MNELAVTIREVLPIIEEVRNRASRHVPLPLYRVDATRGQVDANPRAIAAGKTLTIVLTYQSSAVFKRLNEALGGGDGVGVSRILEEIPAHLPQHKDATAAEAINELRSQPVLGRVLYAGETVVPLVAAPADPGASIVWLPHTGGRPAPGGFSLELYSLDRAGVELLGFVFDLSTAPTEAEAAAGMFVPPDLFELKVGNPIYAAFFWWVVAILTGVTATMVATKAHPRPFDFLWLSDDEFEKEASRLGDAASLEQLLKLRRDLLLRASARSRSSVPEKPKVWSW
jgi:hypothetical protein